MKVALCFLALCLPNTSLHSSPETSFIFRNVKRLFYERVTWKRLNWYTSTEVKDKFIPRDETNPSSQQNQDLFNVSILLLRIYALLLLAYTFIYVPSSFFCVPPNLFYVVPSPFLPQYPLTVPSHIHINLECNNKVRKFYFNSNLSRFWKRRFNDLFN